MSFLPLMLGETVRAARRDGLADVVTFVPHHACPQTVSEQEAPEGAPVTVLGPRLMIVDSRARIDPKAWAAAFPSIPYDSLPASGPIHLSFEDLE